MIIEILVTLVISWAATRVGPGVRVMVVGAEGCWALVVGKWPLLGWCS